MSFYAFAPAWSQGSYRLLLPSLLRGRVGQRRHSEPHLVIIMSVNLRNSIMFNINQNDPYIYGHRGRAFNDLSNIQSNIEKNTLIKTALLQSPPPLPPPRRLPLPSHRKLCRLSSVMIYIVGGGAGGVGGRHTLSQERHSSHLERRGTCLVFESPRASWIRSANRAGVAVVTNANDAVGARATRDITSGR